MNEDQVPCHCSFNMYRSRDSGVEIAHQGCTPRGHTRPLEFALYWGREAARIRFLRKTNGRSASRWEQLDGNQEERTERHFPECTAPRRARTQARSVERCTLGCVSGVDQN